MEGLLEVYSTMWVVRSMVEKGGAVDIPCLPGRVSWAGTTSYPFRDVRHSVSIPRRRAMSDRSVRYLAATGVSGVWPRRVGLRHHLRHRNKKMRERSSA